MPKLYRKIDLALCTQAVMECFSGKWSRNDVLTFVEEWTGIDRALFRKEVMDGNCGPKVEAADTIGMALFDLISDILAGKDIGDLIAPVSIDERIDGMSGKIRKIATLDIWHQLIGHTVKLSLDPLFRARIMPTQHASIPGRGQTRLKDQARRCLRRDKLEINYIQKTDVKNAYGTLMYDTVTDLINKEIRVKDTIKLLQFLGTLAPEGHMIIGGYLDAWLFNYAMSYALRELYTFGHKRRGQVTYYVSKAEAYMDDFGIMAPTRSGLAKAVKKLDRWLAKTLHLQLKMSTGVIKLTSKGDEEFRRKEKKASRRACPGLDMGGYVTHRTYTTIRTRVFLRARRQWLRGWKELQETGTLRLIRAQKIIAYNGFLDQTDSMKIRKKYHTAKLLEAAKKTIAFHGWLDNVKREERINAEYKRYCEYKAGLCTA